MFKLPSDTIDFVIIKEIMAVKVSYFKPENTGDMSIMKLN